MPEQFIGAVDEVDDHEVQAPWRSSYFMSDGACLAISAFPCAKDGTHLKAVTVIGTVDSFREAVADQCADIARHTPSDMKYELRQDA